MTFSAFSQEHVESFQNFKLYDGKVLMIDNNTFQFGSQILFLTNTIDSLKGIFKRGILYPDIFDNIKQNDGSEAKDIKTSNAKNDSAVLTIKASKDLFSNLLSNDSITISDFKETDISNKKPNIRIYDFLLFRQGYANPTYYKVELINDNANKQTDNRTFIKGARLEKLLKGSIII